MYLLYRYVSPALETTSMIFDIWVKPLLWNFIKYQIYFTYVEVEFWRNNFSLLGACTASEYYFLEVQLVSIHINRNKGQTCWVYQTRLKYCLTFVRDTDTSSHAVVLNCPKPFGNSSVAIPQKLALKSLLNLGHLYKRFFWERRHRSGNGNGLWHWI